MKLKRLTLNQKYPREEKLKHKKDISLLFEKGKWYTCGNIRVISFLDGNLLTENPAAITQHKVGVSVSKRYFKKAVDRNRIKRLLREVYRHNKAAFIENFGENSLTMIFYVSKDKPKHYTEIEEYFLKLLKK